MIQMRARLALLVVLAMLAVSLVALAAPASALPGCQHFGKTLVAGAAQRDPHDTSNPGNLHIHHIVTDLTASGPGAVPNAINAFFKSQCP
jgi:hypothetical protein